ncbi:MAG: SAM-dependent chlorinase/fluorinase, partial [Planctomycetes bacterium]|nr:SAM-dependent chlorinase/fluorinase [Planctomycetota bacterium]
MPTISFHKTRPPIALLTDFGTRDNYVGVMKGVIYRICAEARIVDLSHSVGRQDVTEASFLLSSSYEYFPKGTIFVCVVDPGVGTGRAIVCMEANNQFFLAPDNGLLSVVAA